jgi:hypothetical protein
MYTLKRSARSWMAVAVVVAASATVYGQATVWTGTAGNNDWNTAGNWDNGVPVNASGATATISLDAVVNMSANGVSRTLTVSGNGTAGPVLNITKDLLNNATIFTVGSGSDSTYKGTVNHTSGTVSFGTAGTRRLYVGATTTSQSGTGVYNFGGTAASNAPVLNVNGGLSVGSGSANITGTLTLSGHGSVSQGSGTTENFVVGFNNANGTLNVSGGDLTISFANAMNLSSAGSGSSVLNATLTSSGFSTINVGGAVAIGNSASANKATFNLDLDGYNGTVGDIITIINGGAAFGGHGVFANVANDSIISVDSYEFKAIYDNSNHDFKLQVMTIPEPTTVGLFVVASMGLLATRRIRS